MKSGCIRQRILYLTIILLFASWTCYAQPGAGKGSGSGGSSGGNTGGTTGGSQGGQASSGQQGSSSSSSSSNRIEATMLAYEAMDQIAARIGTQVQGHILYIYDSQTFASLQTYEAYAATVGTFETNFRLLNQQLQAHQLAGSGLTEILGSVQTIQGILGRFARQQSLRPSLWI